MKIALVVHGRFHAFDLARELIRCGTDLVLVTNYPARIAEKYGVPPDRVRSCLGHGLATRIVGRLLGSVGSRRFEPQLHRWFSKSAARRLRSEKFDVIHCFSSVAEELFRSVAATPILKTLVRGSSHIRTQSRLLDQEERRVGVPIDKPSPWMITREEREYDLSDAIFVLSSFAQNSFLDERVAERKLRLLRLGSELSRFRPRSGIIDVRYQRIISGNLRVLTVGTFSFRKGAFDLTEAARRLSNRFHFRFVGAVAPEAHRVAAAARQSIEFLSKVDQHHLPKLYEWADLFLFPTIEDGYAMVLAQAQAAGLPIIATTNCGAPDMVTEGENGWIVPIRSPNEIAKRLLFCDANREHLAQMTRRIPESFQPRDWSQVAADFIAQHQVLFSRPPAKEPPVLSVL